MLTFLKFLWSSLAVVFSWVVARLFSGVHGLDSRRAELLAKRDGAATYPEWRRWAREVDDHDGYQTWRVDESSRLFAFDEVTSRIRTLTELRQRRDFAGLLAELATDFHRRMCGITNPLLFSKFPTGTKAAVRMYVSLLQRLIADLASPDTPGPSREQKLAALSDLSRAYGHCALILDSSAAFGFYHLGIVKVLHDHEVLPRVVFGRSSGAIAAAFLCCSSSPTIDALDPDKIDTTAFTKRVQIATGTSSSAQGSAAEETAKNNGPASSSGSSSASSSASPPSSFWRRLNRLFTEGTIMDVSVIMDFVRDNLGDITFLEAYQKTGRVLNIFVHKHVSEGGLNREAGWLLNYLSAPNVTVASAAVASIATPGVYAQVPLMQKTQHGSLVQCVSASLVWTAKSEHFNVSMAIARLRHLFNVNFFIVSDASAKNLPFLSFHGSRSFFGKACHFVSEEFWRISALAARAVGSRHAATLESMVELPQGDVLLFPVTTVGEVLQCLLYPDRKLLERGRLKGERIIWPRLEEIKANMIVERALHDAIVELGGGAAVSGATKGQLAAISALEHYSF